MCVSRQMPIWSTVPTLLVIVGFCLYSPVAADTFISGFEGDLSSTLGAEWQIADALGTTFVTDGVTEGAQALSITHNDVWTNSIFLGSGDLIDVMRTHDTIDLDVTVDAFETVWRQIFVVTQGTGLSWTQVGVELEIIDPDDPFALFATTSVSIDLSDPAGDGLQDWKAAAQQARDDLDSGAATDEWWEVWLILQGGDSSGATEIATIVDNIRFSGGLAADFDGNGAVDGDDFLIWQTGFDNPGDQSMGDANGDGFVDGDDFLIWQTQFGSASGEASAAIPEPASAILLLIGLLAVPIRRR